MTTLHKKSPPNWWTFKYILLILILLVSQLMPQVFEQELI